MDAGRTTPQQAAPQRAAGAPLAPGRNCPLHYRYAPASLDRPAEWQGEVAYVVGGLYGNAPALRRVLELFERERGDKRLVFNGDFHWFDAGPADFAEVQRTVLRHDALRGNVETELADRAADGDAGCGCAYPEWVGDGVVERSNRILQRLRDTLHALPDAAQVLRDLAGLPMTRRLDVGGLRVAVVHGDAQSLAGWGFAAEHLRDPARREAAARWADEAQVDAFACSHTCLPIFQELRGRRWVLNNGAAGMPNFRGDPAGLLTRIATTPFDGPQRRHHVVQDGVHLEAIAVEHDAGAFRARFDALWPPGSDARASYGDRIAHGPDFEPADALRRL